MNKLFFLYLISIFVFSGSAFSGSPKCQEYFSQHLQKNVKYCIQRSQESKNPNTDEPLIYFFHGMGGSSQSWIENGFSETLNNMATKDSQFPAMTFVSFDTDWDSFFSDEGNVTTGPKSYETWFIDEFMKKIESENDVCHQKECRATLGLSMGGFGALKTALKHPDLFSVTAVHCPALAPFGIFESDLKWASYFQRHPIGVVQGGLLLQHIRAKLPNEEIFKENNPSDLIENINPKDIPAIYFDVGGKDYFGFQEGVTVFKNKLQAKGISHEDYFDPNEGHEIFKRRNFYSLSFIKSKLSGK